MGKQVLNWVSGIVSLQKRFLFVHIPKTAGNSIQSVLRDYSKDQLVALRKEQDGIEALQDYAIQITRSRNTRRFTGNDALSDERFSESV